jgi:hypothetical protein
MELLDHQVLLPFVVIRGDTANKSDCIAELREAQTCVTSSGTLGNNSEEIGSGSWKACERVRTRGHSRSGWPPSQGDIEASALVEPPFLIYRRCFPGHPGSECHPYVSNLLRSSPQLSGWSSSTRVLFIRVFGVRLSGRSPEKWLPEADKWDPRGSGTSGVSRLTMDAERFGSLWAWTTPEPLRLPRSWVGSDMEILRQHTVKEDASP